MAPLFDAGRMAWLCNVGPLLRPTSIEDVRDNRNLPPFLLSHSDQIAAQQGWLYGDEQSGWGGRAIERLPNSLVGKLSNVSLSPESQLVAGLQTAPRLIRANGLTRYWGAADLQSDDQDGLKALLSFLAPHYPDEIEAAYARTLREAIDDARLLAKALPSAQTEHRCRRTRSVACLRKWLG